MTAAQMMFMAALMLIAPHIPKPPATVYCVLLTVAGYVAWWLE